MKKQTRPSKKAPRSRFPRHLRDAAAEALGWAHRPDLLGDERIIEGLSVALSNAQQLATTMQDGRDAAKARVKELQQALDALRPKPYGQALDAFVSGYRRHDESRISTTLEHARQALALAEAAHAAMLAVASSPGGLELLYATLGSNACNQPRPAPAELFGSFNVGDRVSRTNQDVSVVPAGTLGTVTDVSGTDSFIVDWDKNGLPTRYASNTALVDHARC